jgi:hypothetical protein
LLETALWIPILVLLMMGTAEFGRLVYTYHQLHKMLEGLARPAGSQQGLNFCDPADAALVSIKQMALTGTADGSATPFINGLTADQVEVRPERYLRASDTLAPCDCSATATGCDAAAGATPPEFITVSIPEGYRLRLNLPGLSLDPILLRPSVRTPFTGGG